MIELCPYTRHECFYTNAKDLGFFRLLIQTNTNDKEQVILDDRQKENLFKLLDCLIIK